MTWERGCESLGTRNIVLVPWLQRVDVKTVHLSIDLA